jgi:hypothetical protein
MSGRVDDRADVDRRYECDEHGRDESGESQGFLVRNSSLAGTLRIPCSVAPVLGRSVEPIAVNLRSS